MPKSSKTCKKAFKNGVLRTGTSGGLYVNKRSSKTGKMYKLYCTGQFRKSKSKKLITKSLF